MCRCKALAQKVEWKMRMAACRGKTNFFEKRVGDYQKAGVMAGLANDGMHTLSFDDDF